jgi:hypothetical protein
MTIIIDVLIGLTVEEPCQSVMLVLLVTAAKILAVKVGTSIDLAHLPCLCPVAHY